MVHTTQGSPHLKCYFPSTFISPSFLVLPSNVLLISLLLFHVSLLYPRFPPLSPSLLPLSSPPPSHLVSFFFCPFTFLLNFLSSNYSFLSSNYYFLSSNYYFLSSNYYFLSSIVFSSPQTFQPPLPNLPPLLPGFLPPPPPPDLWYRRKKIICGNVVSRLYRR